MHRSWNYVIWSKGKKDMVVETAESNSVVTRALLDLHPVNVWTVPEQHNKALNIDLNSYEAHKSMF
jgi:hypothetical protein